MQLVNILFVGLRPTNHSVRRDAIEASMKDRGNEAHILSLCWPECGTASFMVLGNPYLDIVYFCNEAENSLHSMGEGCKKLAEEMSVHPQGPWLFLEKELDFLGLGTSFRMRKVPVPVYCGPIEDVILRRWETRAKLVGSTT